MYFFVSRFINKNVKGMPYTIAPAVFNEDVPGDNSFIIPSPNIIAPIMIKNKVNKLKRRLILSFIVVLYTKRTINIDMSMPPKAPIIILNGFLYAIGSKNSTISIPSLNTVKKGTRNKLALVSL